MIVSLQRKFILISAISIFVVFSGIFLVLVFFSNRQLDRTMDTLADAISFNDGVFPEFDPAQPSQPFPYDNIITEETRFSTRFFTVWVDDAGHITHINIDSVSSISEEQVEDFAQTALSEGTRRGWVSDYRYRVVETDTGSTLVFANGTMNRSMSGRLLLTAFLVLLGSAFLILALIIIISKRVVHPVAESYEKQKQFITDANHELKTPLTLILSNLDIVEADVGKNEWLDDIRSESERMGLLINQMVTLCRMDESDTPLALADVDLSGVVDDTVSELEALAADRKKKLTASVEPGVHCRGDEALLRRLAAILLDNAVKYCDAGGEIRVSLRCRHHPVFTVENTYAEVDRLELDDQIESVIRQVRIEEVKNRRISALSKGYKQRVGIAQALLGNPKVIILDEPTVGLDPLQIIEIRDLIRQLGQEHTVILSSHILSEVQAICEKILIIAHGRLVAFDEPDQLERSLLGTNEISFTTDAPPERVRSILAGVPHVFDIKVSQPEKGLVRAQMQTNAKDIYDTSREVFFAFAKRDIALLELNLKKASLEDIFIELTEGGVSAVQTEASVPAAESEANDQ